MASLTLAVAACSNDDGSPILDLGSEAIGRCLDVDETIEAEVSELPEVPCDQPHSHEIVGIVISPESVYPGFDALEATAQARCLVEFEEYVGISPFESELFYSWLVPTLTSWDRENDRQIICVAGARDSEPLEASVFQTRR